ncbi:unnamed protein product, partial [Didymodactylos carnosus]
KQSYNNVWTDVVPLPSTHGVALTSPYGGSNPPVNRTFVPSDRINWTVQWDDYTPVDYTSPSVVKDQITDKRPFWADDPDPKQVQHYNKLDGEIDRTSFHGVYYVDEHTNRPRNPVGRTGMTQRGGLGRWGPNHAADPIIT